FPPGSGGDLAAAPAAGAAGGGGPGRAPAPGRAGRGDGSAGGRVSRRGVIRRAKTKERARRGGIVEFYSFHPMPWPYLAPDFVERYPSSWVTYSNAEFDPERGHALYNRYLDELELADRLGFDGVCVNEHHQTAYGLMPAPNIIAAMLTQRVKRAKIALLGNALPLHDH